MPKLNLGGYRGYAYSLLKRANKLEEAVQVSQVCMAPHHDINPFHACRRQMQIHNVHAHEVWEHKCCVQTDSLQTASLTCSSDVLFLQSVGILKMDSDQSLRPLPAAATQHTHHPSHWTSLHQLSGDTAYIVHYMTMYIWRAAKGSVCHNSYLHVLVHVLL